MIRYSWLRWFIELFWNNFEIIERKKVVLLLKFLYMNASVCFWFKFVWRVSRIAGNNFLLFYPKYTSVPNTFKLNPKMSYFFTQKQIRLLHHNSNVNTPTSEYSLFLDCSLAHSDFYDVIFVWCNFAAVDRILIWIKIQKNSQRLISLHVPLSIVVIVLFKSIQQGIIVSKIRFASGTFWKWFSIFLCHAKTSVKNERMNLF